MGLIAVKNTFTDTDMLYDMDTKYPYNPKSQVVSMRFYQCQLDAAKTVVECVGRDHKIAGIKLIRGLSNMGLFEAKTLWELAEKQIDF